jgi:DNA-binding HxlR family transcriptional regulator
MGTLNGSAYPAVPPKVEYSLTPLGRTLIERLRPICKWADQYLHTLEAA